MYHRKRTIRAIDELRIKGLKPAEIAQEVGISVYTVYSHIRRHPDIPGTRHCDNCGHFVPQVEGRKVKRFCCDQCRSTYWNRKKQEARYGKEQA